MRMKKIFIALGAIIAFPSCGEGPSVEVSAAKPSAVEECYALAKKLELYGFDRAKEYCRLSVTQQYYDDDRMCRCIDVGGPSYNGEEIEGLREPVYGEVYWFTLDRDTKELLGLMDFYLVDWSLERQNLPEEEPILSRDQAVEQAKGYIETIGTKMTDLVLVSAIYDRHTSTHGKVWRIGFSRQVGGYRFKYDYVNVEVHEKHGLRAYFKQFFSVPCAIPKKLVEADALEEQCVAKVKEMLDAAGFAQKDMLVNISRTWHEVLITNPAMYMYKSDKAKAMRKESTALVHECEYTIKWHVRKGDRVEEDRKVRLSVCFDAGTGEFLCGDYLFF